MEDELNFDDEEVEEIEDDVLEIGDDVIEEDVIEIESYDYEVDESHDRFEKIQFRMPDLPITYKIIQLLNNGKRDEIEKQKLNFKLAYACLKSKAYESIGYCSNCDLRFICAFPTHTSWFYKKCHELRERVEFLAKKVGLKY